MSCCLVVLCSPCAVPPLAMVLLGKLPTKFPSVYLAQLLGALAFAVYALYYGEDRKPTDRGH